MNESKHSNGIIKTKILFIYQIIFKIVFKKVKKNVSNFSFLLRNKINIETGETNNDFSTCLTDELKIKTDNFKSNVVNFLGLYIGENLHMNPHVGFFY